VPEPRSRSTPSHTNEVLFFTTPHCPICRSARPTVNKVAESFEGQVDFREVDSVREPQTTANHNVKGVPTLIAFHDGDVVRRVIGARSEGQISDVFTASLTGTGSRGSLTRTDRVQRLGIASVFAVAAVISEQPILWILAAGATAFALWDLIKE